MVSLSQFNVNNTHTRAQESYLNPTDGGLQRMAYVGVVSALVVVGGWVELPTRDAILCPLNRGGCSKDGWVISRVSQCVAAATRLKRFTTNCIHDGDVVSSHSPYHRCIYQKCPRSSTTITLRTSKHIVSERDRCVYD